MTGFGAISLTRMGLGASSGHRAGSGLWSSALLALDFANNRYRFDGANYSSEAAVLTAAGGSKTGSTYSFGPYEIGSSLVTNGDFQADVSGWNAQNSGLISWVSGQLQLNGNGGNNASASQPETVVANRCYRLSALVTRVSGGSAPFLSLSGAAGLGGAFVQAGALAATDTPTQMSVLWGAIQTSIYVGIKMNSATAAGNNLLDNVTLKEAVPVKGMPGGVFSFETAFTMPAAGAGNKVLLAWDDDSERNTVKLLVNSAGELRIVITFNSIQQASLLLGSPVAGSSNKVAASLQPGNNFAQLNGDAVIQNNNTGQSPGKLRIGQDFTGNPVDAGAVSRIEVYGERAPASWIWIEGDSYGVGSADGTSIWKSAQAAGRRGFPTAVGGSTLTNQRDRILAHPGFQTNPLLHWDGSPNGYGTLTQDRAKYAAIAAVKPDGRFVFFVPLVAPSTASDINAAAAALRPAILADFPNNSFDAQAIVDGLSSPFQADGVHLTSTAMDAVWAAFVASPIYARLS